MFLCFVPNTNSVGNDPSVFSSWFLIDILFNFFIEFLKGWPNSLSVHLCICYLWNPAAFWLHMICIVIQYFNSCFSPGRKLTRGLDGGASYLDFPEVFQDCVWQLANQTCWRLIVQDKNSFVEGTSFLTNSFTLTFLGWGYTERKLGVLCFCCLCLIFKDTFIVL